MVKYTIPLDLYNWFITRAEVIDDPRHTQDSMIDEISLHRDTGSRLLNGIHVARIMLQLKKVAVTRLTKPFALNEKIQHLKDQPGQPAK
jgi:hypothetical protein